MSSEPARAVRQATQRVIEGAGWSSGSSIEDRVAFRLWKWGFEPHEVAQQHRALTYRLDFAFVGIKVALEVDGPRHIYDPATARRDAERDAKLRAVGWLVFRIDDEGDGEALDDQLCRVAAVVRALDPGLGRRHERKRLLERGRR